MSFKLHLLIVSIIIVIMYLAWGFTRSQPNTATDDANSAPTYSVSVIHASWGLNCPAILENDNVLDKAYVRKSDTHSNRPHADNALQIVSDLCQGEVECTIPLNDATFEGMAPANCNEKKLTVEYRCFAFDRPWRAQGSSNDGSLSITCANKEAQ